jgi:hypothetical protein
MTAATSKRILLTDAAVKREPFAEGKPRIIRDTKVAAVLLVGRWPRRIRLICSGSRGFVFRNSERGLGQACCRGKGFLSPRSGSDGRSLLVVRGFHYCQGLHLLADPAQFAQILTRSVYRPLASRNFRNAILGTF